MPSNTPEDEERPLLSEEDLCTGSTHPENLSNKRKFQGHQNIKNK